MRTKILQSINLIRRGSGASLNLFRYTAKSCDSQGVVTATSYGASDEHPMSTRSASDGSTRQTRVWKYAAMVLVLLTLGVGEAWGSSVITGRSYVKTETVEPAKGLVYCSSSKSANPSQSDYKRYCPGGSATGSGNETCYVNLGAAKSGVYIYCWAKPARGYEFDHWDGYEKGYLPYGDQNKSKKLDIDSWNGVKDEMVGTCGNGASTWKQHQAYFKPATSYTITYTPPVGGSYSVSYSYLETRPTTGEEYEFYTNNSESYNMTPSSENASVKSYAADIITLSVPSETTNFAGWYEGTTQKSSAKSYTYPITKDATIIALFKTMSLGEATGDLSPAVEALGAMSPNPTITVPVTAHGSWSASDFTVTFTENGSRGDITKGTVAYALNSGNVLSSEGTLTIPFTYNPSSWGNTEVNVTVSPKDGSTYGNSIEFTIRASATQVLNYEACILLDGETEPQSSNTGTLAEMVTKANTMDSKFTLQLAKDVTISSPLSLCKSMKFDLNDKTITATGTSAFSIDAEGVDVQIVDEGFSKIGKIATSSSQSGNVNVVTFTQKAKLTMQGGTLSANNTGSGSAYGIDVKNGSTFYMTNGKLTVTASTGSAEGVHVATASDYATLNGGSVTVSAPSNAYGLWSAGQSNITNATISVETTTGANAYGVYVNGGVSTLTTNTITATAKTTNAYGAYVNAGRLNGNGGSFAAEAVTSGVYGVHVQAGAEAMLQMNAVVTAEATGANGTSVFGVNNLGTVSLTNVTITATSPTTNATAVNTATSAVYTTIEGGIYRANTTGGTAYGLHHQYGALNVDGGEFKAIGGGNSIYGARAAVDATIANATLWGETQGSGNTAYGFVGGVANKNITLTNCTITGLSATSKAYAIYSRTNVTATNCTLTATTTNAGEAYGLYAEAGTNKLTNCNATVTSNTTTAYGFNHVAGTLTIDGGEYDVTAKQATTSTVGNALVYGVYNAASQTTTIKDASFTVTASNNACSQQVYGVYAKGILNSTNSTYTVTGRQQIWGIYGESTLNLSGNTISASASGVSTNGIKSYGIYAKKAFTFADNTVRATATSTNVYALFFDATNSVGTIVDGKYYAMGNGTTDFAPLNAAATVGKVKIQGGVYSTNVNLDKYTDAGYNVYNLDNAHPDFATGHRFIVADVNPTPYVCYIKGGNKYTTLEAAMQYTKDNSGSNYTIIMTQDYTLPEGDYELPSNATLLVPRNADQTTICGSTPAKRTTKSIIAENIRLTLASGAHINVNGKIEVGGEMYCAETGYISYILSEYARIHMEEGSLIQLNSGAYLYAWGYITGKGEIKAKNNSEVHEMFQIGDMKSMSNIGYVYYSNSEKYFFINQYYIQNIEVPTTYYYNSRLISAMASYYNSKYMGDDNVKLVGTSEALFLVTTNDESSWVRKWYDAENDYQVWDVNSQAQLGSITIAFKEGVPVLGSATFNSSGYYLPITNNMKIHVLDGDFAITQTSELLPGASVEIDKTASLTINSGKNVYVFDNDQWPFGITQVNYSPSWNNGTKPTRTKKDAAVNVHGKVVVKGGLFTTNSITDGTNATNGANIYSNNEDAGTISYSTAAASASSIQLITSVGSGNSKVKKTVSMESAKLKNEDESYTATAGTTSGEAWIYLNNLWQKTYTNGCFEVIGSKVYAKPSGYVALKKSQTVNNKLTGVEETNHTYLTADDKILILMDECQWWEVEATSDPAVFECKKTGYEGFYYYDNTTSKWKLKTVNVKFYSAETGDNVLKTIVTDYNGIPDQAVIATNPTKGTTAEYTYSFYGWKSSVTGTEYKWTDQLEVATADMSYRPVFTATKRNYTITLVNANNGSNVPLEVPYGETPEYTPKKDATAQYTYTFNGWSPAFTTVTGTATYTAQWLSTVNNYNITWKNGNEILEVDENQPYGTATAFNGASLPTKDADDDFEYAFSKWKSSLNGNSYNNGSTPTVAGETTYEAQYTTTPRYAITFNNYDGTQLARTIYTQGETPAYGGVPARKRDDNGYFIFIGWKNSNGTDYAANVTLPTVTKKETYTAQYEYVTDFFTITLKNVDGNGATWSGKFGKGSTPFYNPNEDDVPVTPTKTSADPHYSYVFNGWSLSSGGAKLDPTPAVTEDATYWALFTQVENKYTVSFAANNDAWGIVSRDDVKEVPYGTAITVNGNTLTVNGKTITATPAAEDAQYMYSFERWDNVPATVTGATNIQAVFKAYVATVEAGGNTTYHATISDAITTANTKTNNPTVTMYKNASTASEIEITKSMTIDLNGKTITATQASATGVFKVNGTSQTLTIRDSGGNGQINHTASYSGGYMYGINVQKGSLSIESGTIYARNNAANRAYGIYTDNNASLVTVSGTGVVHAESSTSSFGIYTNNTCNLTMNGGTFTASGASCRGIYVKGTTILTNATVTASGSSCYGIFAKSGALTIHSGTYTATGTSSVTIYYEAGTVTVNGGLFSGTTKELTPKTSYGTNKVALKGGVYVHDADLTVNCATHYRVKALADTHPEYADGYRYTVNDLYSVTWTGESVTERTDEVLYGETPSYGEEPTKDPDVSQVYTFKWMNTSNAEIGVKAVTADVTYAGSFTGSPRPYTIKFVNDDGSELQSSQVGWGSTPTYDGETPEHSYTDDDYEYTFAGWKPALAPVNGTATYTAKYDRSAKAITVSNPETVTDNTSATTTTVENGGTLTIGDTENDVTLRTTVTVVENGGELVVSKGSSIGKEDPSEESIIIVESGGQLDVKDGGSVDADVFELIATHETTTQTNEYDVSSTTSTYSSGQVDGSGKVGDDDNTKMKAYFKLSHNGGFKARQWYAVAVPWQIAVPTYQVGGVAAYQNGAYKSIQLGSDYDLVRYDGGIRAERGNVQDCWVYVEDDIDVNHDSAYMHPGVFYMVYLAQKADTLRFERASGTAFRYDKDAISLAVQNNDPSSATGDDNWNGIANPTMHYAYVNANATSGQQYVVDEEGHGSYDLIDLEANALIVGQPVFVQTISESVVVNKDKEAAFSAPSGAPRRVSGKEVWNTQKIEVQLVPTGLSYSDRVFIQTEQGKADRYTIGADLAKAGVSAYKAQMWINRYDHKLCYNTVAPVNNSASYPLGISIPKAGEYAITVPEDCVEGDNIYLTIDGRVVWNLSFSPYVADFEKGTTTRYGIRLVRNLAPAVTTDIENAGMTVDESKVQKILLDDQVYILRGGNMYSVEGQMVK